MTQWPTADEIKEMFPTAPGFGRVVDGMTLRDWFAGQALAGLLAYPDNGSGFAPDRLSKTAFEYADAMMEARK